ncbi:hypothetical protein V6N13_054476 [Hibiscus sabdariffa]
MRITEGRLRRINVQDSAQEDCMRPIGVKKTFGKYIACSTRMVHFLRILQSPPYLSTWKQGSPWNMVLDSAIQARPTPFPVGGSNNIESRRWS